MPAKTATRGATRKTARKPATRPASRGKQPAIGSARRKAKAASTTTRQRSRRVAQGIQHDDRKRMLDTGIHAKKDTGRQESAGKVAVSTPNVPGYTNQVDAEKYNAMKDILLQVLPRKAPGYTQGEMFDAVRGAAGHKTFPGATARWWAKCVQLDLEAKGVLIREPTMPLRWHLR